jgi:sec-independent protein translocase protein TatA
MPNVGPMEIAIVLIIALVIFGPSRLPELGKSAGKGMREFKASISGESHDDAEDEKPARVVANSASDAEPAKS